MEKHERGQQLSTAELGPVGSSGGNANHTGKLVHERSHGMEKLEVSVMRNKEKSDRVSQHKVKA